MQIIGGEYGIWWISISVVEFELCILDNFSDIIHESMK